MTHRHAYLISGDTARCDCGVTKRPTLKERDFQRQVMELAQLSGWETLHVRTSMQQGRYMTATAGTMAKGWPDLLLIHRSQQRLIFAELKADKGRLRPDQSRVLSLLYSLVEGPTREWAEVHVWKPADWPTIEATLTRKEERAA
jgi:hypothetical protein